MIFGDLVGLKLPEICLTEQENPPKNLTQETCPNRGLNPGPLRDRRVCYRLLHRGEPKQHSHQDKLSVGLEPTLICLNMKQQTELLCRDRNSESCTPCLPHHTGLSCHGNSPPARRVGSCASGAKKAGREAECSRNLTG